MPTDTDTLIKRLEEQHAAEGNLPELLLFYKSLLEIQDAVRQKIDIPALSLTGEAVKARLFTGKPLLGLDELGIDWPLLRQTYRQVLNLFLEYSELFGPIPSEIVDDSPGKVINKRTVLSWYRGRVIKIGTPTANGTQPVLCAIFSASLGPFLAARANAVRHLITPEMWRRGYCPVCGGNPDFSYLAKDEGARWLVCSRCETEWLFQRIQCPYCDNYDQEKLSYFTVDDGKYRLYVCEKCKRYIKAIDMRRFNGQVLLPLERLTTLDLDRQANERGYT